MANSREKLLRLAAECEILALKLARCEDIKFRRGGVIPYLLAKCGHLDHGLAYRGTERLPQALSSAVRAVVVANDKAVANDDYGLLAGALMGLTRVIRVNVGGGS